MLTIDLRSDTVTRPTPAMLAAMTAAETGEVLMFAYMNKEAWQKTLATGESWFWSRSRKQLWHKGETSGNIQKVKEIYYDCDEDALLLKVEQAGVACHTGNKSCFYRRWENK